MPKVKCRFCGKQIDKDTAFKVKHGRSNWYYCDENHSKAKTSKEKFFDVAYDVFGKTTNTIFFKEMDEISNVHGYKKMKSYLEDNFQYLKGVMQKDFSSEYGKCRYFSAILKNNLGDYEYQEPEVIKKVEVEIYNPAKKQVVKKTRRKGMDEIMKGLLDG